MPLFVEGPVKPSTRSSALMMLAFTAACAIAQDLASIAPQLVKIEFEDERVRVVHLRVAPHEAVPTHERPARVVIPLSTSDVAMPRADGSVATVRSAAGEAGWGGPTKRTFTNLDAPVDNIIVDLKKAPEPARPVKQAPAPAASGIADRFHHWRFENQYVRVLDLRIPAGETTEPLTYASETVTVAVTAGKLSEQQGKGWGKVRQVELGHVEVAKPDQQQRPRRLQNRGREEYHAIVVQLLQ